VEKLKQFASDVCTMGEIKVTARTPHARKQSINSAIGQDVKPFRALLPSINVCSVSGPPRFVTLIACISSLQHASGVQCKMESNWTPRRYAGRVGERRSKQTRGGRRRLNWRPAENKEIVTQLHFQGKTVCI